MERANPRPRRPPDRRKITCCTASSSLAPTGNIRSSPETGPRPGRRGAGRPPRPGRSPHTPAGTGWRNCGKIRRRSSVSFFPSSLVAPLLQTGRLLDDVRSARGLPRRDDFLMLAYDLSEALVPKAVVCCGSLPTRTAFCASRWRSAMGHFPNWWTNSPPGDRRNGPGEKRRRRRNLELTLRRAAP